MSWQIGVPAASVLLLSRMASYATLHDAVFQLL